MQQHIATPDRGFRGDIQGLRAVAVLVVVFYHAHVSFLGGGYTGVDIFFVISGFLITDLLWREIEQTGKVSFSSFYGRRIRRLLPMAVLVLSVTMVVSLRVLPPLELRSVWKDGVATALYAGNYRFAAVQTNYLLSSAPPSPFQQYWSLGVEEQFYLLWPLLLLLVPTVVWRFSGSRNPFRPSRAKAPAHARVSPPSRGAALVVLGVLAAGSFAFSLWLTWADEPWAFFSLPTRAWELAAGGLIALAAPILRRAPASAAAVAGWAGLAAVAFSVLAFTPTTTFPGTAALAPVLGTAAILGAGLNHRARGYPGVALGRRPLLFIGAISYSWYLWHWPVLVLAPDILGHSLSESTAVLVAAGSGILAWVTYRWVEAPARRSQWLTVRPRRSLVGGFGLSAAGVSTCVVVALLVPPLTGRGDAPVAGASGRRPTLDALSEGRSGGTTPTAVSTAQTRLVTDQRQLAIALANSARTVDVPSNLQPSLLNAAGSEAPPFFDGCLLSFTDTWAPPCVFGDIGSPTTVVLFGDSHAAMWFPALDEIANARHWRLVVWTKATCPPADVTLVSPDLGRTYTECDEWRRDVTSQIYSLHPRLVVLGTAPNYDSPYGIIEDGPMWLAGLAHTVRVLRSSGARVMVLGPVESPDWVVPDCLSAHLYDVPACNVTPRETHAGPGLVGYDNAGQIAERDAVVSAGGAFVDVKPWFCAETTCPVIVDNLLVFRDNSHITVQYADFLAPLISDEVDLVLHLP
ncbi:MAG TPA: acyltransferase family protein [Acidimicrobiales bacterium]|nr:acyltransferase family protein [Acidimicrobiales bacterium]